MFGFRKMTNNFYHSYIMPDKSSFHIASLVFAYYIRKNSICFFEKKIYFHMRKNQQKNTTNKTMYKRQSKEKAIE